MATEILLPQWGMAMEEGTIVSWLKAEGDLVTEGEPVVEIETDKMTVEVVAPISGVLSDIRAREGETVAVRAILGLIE